MASKSLKMPLRVVIMMMAIVLIAVFATGTRVDDIHPWHCLEGP